MKVDQFRKLLTASEALYRNAGNASAAEALSEIAGLFAGHETKTVAAVTALISKVAVDDSFIEPARITR